MAASEKRNHEKPSVTVDVVIFTVKDNDLKVLLVKRNHEPFEKSWALPGGFVNIDESLEAAAARELFEETGVKDVYLEQLYTFGEPKRDPRERVITVVYFALADSDKIKLKRIPTKENGVSETELFSARRLPKLAFDHEKIVKYAIQRLEWKLEYTTVAFSLLPEKFTLSQLQKVYEIIFNKKIDKRNFRKKIISLDLIESTKKVTKSVPHRPAKLYSFKRRIGEIVEIF